MAKARNEPDISRNAPGISKIGVRGYKCFRDYTEIEIKPLTILAGANNSGKSSIIQPLLLLKQTLEDTGDPGPLKLFGPHVQFTMAEEVLFRPLDASQCRPEEFSVHLSFGSNASLVLTFASERAGKQGIAIDPVRDPVVTTGTPSQLPHRCGFVLARAEYRRGERALIFRPEMKSAEIAQALKSFLGELAVDPGDLSAKGVVGQWQVQRHRCFLKAVLEGLGDLYGSIPMFDVPTIATYRIRDVLHVPAWRGELRRTYPKMAVEKSFPGIFPAYTASVIEHWQQLLVRFQPPPESAEQRVEGEEKQLDILRNQLARMRLTGDIKVRAMNAVELEIVVSPIPDYRHVGTQRMVNLADVGFGVAQTLHGLVAVLVAKPGQMVIWEEPESNLHPNAQRVLAGILADAALRGVKVVAETHSALLLREIATLIAKKAIGKEQVAMYWFQRGEDGVATKHLATLDDNGAWGDWPQDFDEIEREADMAYLDQVELRGK